MPSDVIISNPLKLSDEEFETIENLAACNYTPEQIALYLDVNFNSFEKFRVRVIIQFTDC